MKRVLLILFLIPLMAVAQKAVKPNLNKALAAFKEGKLDEAKEIIDLCTTYEKTMNDGNTWYYRGLIYASIDTTSNEAYKNLAPDAFNVALESFAKADQMAKEGKEYNIADANGFPILKSQQIPVWANTYLNKGAGLYQEDDLDGALANFEKVQKIFETYHLDSIYYHVNLVFEFLKLEYYNHYKVFRQAEKYYEEVNDACANLMVNYATFTFPAQFLLSKLERHLRVGAEAELYAENESIFLDYEVDTQDVPKHIVYIVYRALSSYYVGKFDEAAKLLNNLLNEVSLKKYPYAQLEIKSLLALQYTLMHDFELFNQLSNGIQRQIRMFGKDTCESIQLYLKILKIATSEAKKEKAKKIHAVIPRLSTLQVGYFAPTMLVKLDERFVNLLTEF